MFKETKEGQTNYCTHKNPNTSGICDKCLGKEEKPFSPQSEGWEEMFKEEFKAYFTPEEMNIALDVVDTIISYEIHLARIEERKKIRKKAENLETSKEKENVIGEESIEGKNRRLGYNQALDDLTNYLDNK